MDRIRFRRVTELFEAACELDQSERARLLDDACQDDRALREAVERMLQHDDGSDDARDSMVGAGQRVFAEAASSISPDSGGWATANGAELVGTCVDGYKLLRTLGAGGMGIVYEAEQERPKRRVALKVLSHALVARRMFQRFDLEAQVLARLQHPNIAQIFDTGTLRSDGRDRPYLVMELVEGEPLTRYADRSKLNVRQRLELILAVCEGVEHAHQRGVIHRDLKPGNILVDKTGRPKILDFGIARVTNADVRVTTLHTSAGQMIGTLPYMSPEQVRGQSDEVDIRADVYALGVILFQLLTGELPLDLSGRTVIEAARIIAETDPPALGTVNRSLRGDLEAIVAKALEKDLGRRYASASALAADINRHLGNEPILARPASNWYQVRKFARRNKPIVAGVATAFVALVLGFVVTRVQLARALRAEELAEARLVQVTEANAVAAATAARAERVSGFLRSTFSLADPDARGGRELTVRVLLDETAKRISGELHDDPLVEASIHLVVGRGYGSIGLYPQAEGQLRDALRLYEDQLDPHHSDAAVARNRLAEALMQRGSLAEAERYVMQIRSAPFSAISRDDEQRIVATNTLGRIRFRQGRLDEAERLFTEAADARAARFGDEDRMSVVYATNLGVAWLRLGKLEQAEAVFRRTLKLRRSLYADGRRHIAESLNNLGSTLRAGQKFEEAEAVFREALDIFRRLFPNDHRQKQTALSNLGGVLLAQRDFDAAEPIARELLDVRRDMYGEENALVAKAMHNLGVVLHAKGDYQQAAELLVEALAMRRRILGEEHWRTAVAKTSLARAYKSLARLDEADHLLGEAQITFLGQFGENDRRTLKVKKIRNQIAQDRAISRHEPDAPRDTAVPKD